MPRCLANWRLCRAGLDWRGISSCTYPKQRPGSQELGGGASRAPVRALRRGLLVGRGVPPSWGQALPPRMTLISTVLAGSHGSPPFCWSLGLISTSPPLHRPRCHTRYVLCDTAAWPHTKAPSSFPCLSLSLPPGLPCPLGSSHCLWPPVPGCVSYAEMGPGSCLPSLRHEARYPVSAQGSQDRGQIGAIAASLCHSHSNVGSLTH